MRVLIVEDEYYLADDLAQALRKSGIEVLGPIGTLDEAEKAAEQAIDFAVLDMNLHGELAYVIADRLGERGVPFVIATGYDLVSLPERFAQVPSIEKPFEPAAVMTMLPEADRTP